MLHFNTVNKILKDTLEVLMESKELDSFRLVGGTALSLQLGHRISVDIDLFSDAEYGSLDFVRIEKFLQSKFQYVDFFINLPTALGKSYLVGENKDKSVKLDLFYTDKYIYPQIEEKCIRLASMEEIAAMKIDVVQRGGRKKDFWDLHELLEHFSISQLIEFHQRRYPYSHDKDLIVQNLINFEFADEDFSPVCLRGKYWEFIKDDFIEESQRIKNTKS